MPSTMPGSLYKRIPKTQIVSAFRSPCPITGISPDREGGAWICDYASKNVRYIDHNGEVKVIIGYGVNIKDVDVSPTTQNLWACSHEDHSIMECTEETPSIRFQTDYRPYSVCVTLDEQVIVGMEKRVTKYSTNGKILLSTSASSSLSCLPLFCRPARFKGSCVCTPHRISECHMTRNFAVVDLDWSDDGGNDRPYVLVMNKNFQELFRYHGNTPRDVTVRGETNSFYPCDARYDSDGCLVIGDTDNRCIHLLTGHGQYLRLIHTDRVFPRALGLNEHNVLWSVFGVLGEGDVKLMLYNRTE
ncbi:uncharacterized protein LOC110448337 [Mizuhopecten yessoensis]|uniref:uncharacterized protein LOC110448337 n=1 Tax=Mizuhopecten yessoensis TaxID=6573 RepID=UPI000B45AA0E|nr:uncharacterized protein LOC110448337 [Mizuhopecten yessoensis]